VFTNRKPDLRLGSAIFCTFGKLCGRYAANVIIVYICFPTGAGELPAICLGQQLRGYLAKAPESPCVHCQPRAHGAFSSPERSPTGPLFKHPLPTFIHGASVCRQAHLQMILPHVRHMVWARLWLYGVGIWSAGMLTVASTPMDKFLVTEKDIPEETPHLWVLT